MRERVVEKRLRQGIEALGGLCYKIVVPGRRGPPDRLCAMWFILPYMVETKAPGEVPEEHQAREHERLRERNMVVRVLDTIEKVDKHLAWLRQLENRSI